MTTECPDNKTSDGCEEKEAPTYPEDQDKVADYELSLFRNASLTDIQYLFNYIDRATLTRVITYLLDAPRVLIVGAGENHSNAMFMSYRGSMEFPDWHAMTTACPCGGRLVEEATAGDVVFAIATCPEHPKNPFKDETIQLAKRARDNRAKVVAIVDATDKSLSSFANEVLVVPIHSEVLRSHIVTAVLIETIVGVTVLRSDF